MVPAIIILSILLAIALIIIGALAIKNELLLRLAEDTVMLNEEMLSFNRDLKNAREGKAYDGKYYPCVLLLGVKYNADMSGTIMDFSQYDDKKIIGMTVMNKDKPPKDVEEYLSDLDEEDDTVNILIKNALVFQRLEGVWDWKEAK